MPFHPLPTIFAEEISRLDPDTDTVLELGSGEGHFRALLADLGHTCLGLERRHPASGVQCDVVGDARRPPVRAGSVSVLVAANLVRHLTPRHHLAKWVAHWRGLLKPGGALFLFEDEPSQATIGTRNFRDLQAFLARLMPETRGPLLSLARFREMVVAPEEPAQWTFGRQRNQETISATEVVRFLSGGQGTPTGPVAGLIRSIGRDGLDPGEFWWARVGPRANEVEL